MRTAHLPVKLGAAALAAALSGGLLAAPAAADTQTSGTASATVADVVAVGKAIHIQGTGWTGGSDPSNGSTIAVKLGDALDTEPASGPVTNPATGTSADSFDVWAAIEANADGSFSADIPFPTPDNTSPALPSAWAVGTTHTLRLLTGSMESGDTGRSVLLTFAIGDGLVTTATTAADGTATVTFSGGNFPAGEVLSVAHGATALQWTVRSGRTSTVQDTLTVAADGSISASVVLAPGTAPAGDLTLTVTGDQGTDKDVTVQVPPSVTFGAGTALGASGTLTLGNLATGATISQVKLGDTVLASNLTEDGTGKATAAYAIPASIVPVSYPLVITQTAPDARAYTSTVTVYPDETIKGADKFAITSTTADQGFYQGFYQSAYSAKENALYVTASDRGTGNGGYIYKLDPGTLAIEASYNTVDHDGFTKTGAFGIGVDDVHGNVWVSNTGSNSVAVYKESDLSFVKQFPADTTSHARDVVFDRGTNRVFVSSASEGSSATANGYISVFDATTLEKITDVQTGTRDVFNPVSLALGNGKVYSPSLGSNKVAVIDTTTLTPTFLTIDGIDVGGRGASGIAYDAADNRLFVASQNSNEVVIADAATGATIKQVPTGRQALNVAFDDVNKLAYVANYGGTSVSVLDVDGNKVAALPIATANHVSVDGKGDAFVVDKTAANKVWKITPTGLALVAGTPSISGTVQVGRTVTATTGTWTAGTTFTYQWLKNGATIAGATKAGYAIPASLSGAQLSVKVTGSKTGYTSQTKVSTAKKVAAGTLVSHVPAISGTVQVGRTVTATTGTWTTGTTFTYRWLKNGTTIAGATKAGYTIPASLSGAQLAVKVTGSKTGYATQAKVSTAKKVAAGTLVSHVPVIKGKASVGRTLSASTGTWTAGTSFKYQWKRNGVAVRGATKSTYKVTAADIGRRVSVTVTGSKSGYAAVTRASAATVKVPKLVATVTGKLSAKKVSHSKRVRLAVTVKAPGVVPTGKVTVLDGKRVIKSKVVLRHGKITITLPKLARTGTHTLTVKYAGDAKVAARTSAKLTLKVTR